MGEEPARGVRDRLTATQQHTVGRGHLVAPDFHRSTVMWLARFR
jgi:hypothetical protein